MTEPGKKDLSFTKEDRLLGPDEFAKVRRAGKRVSSRSFTVYMLPNGLCRTRLGLSVSAKAGCAVKRNRVKRLIREFFRLRREVFPDSTDVLVTVKSVERVKGLADVAEELEGALGAARSGK